MDSVQYQLSNGIARCLGEDCEEKEGCLRYEQRMLRGTHTPVARSLRRPFQARYSPCEHRINDHHG